MFFCLHSVVMSVSCARPSVLIEALCQTLMFPLCQNRCGVLYACVALFAFASATRAAEWENSVSTFIPGPFPEPKPIRLQYGFGWNGLTAARADLRLAKTPDERFQLEGMVRTMGMAKALWNFEGRHVSICDARTLRPIEVRETENVRSKRSDTTLTYTPEGVVSRQEEQKDSVVKSKTREFKFPNLLSLTSALLYVHSRPLPASAVEHFVVYPSTSAYFCTVTVAGREHITVPTGNYEAIRLDVQLNKVGKKRELLPHKKFKKATVWLSDDPNRFVLRVEAQIFIGTVFAELQSVQFDDAKP